MARSLLLTCDNEYFEDSRPIGTCAARIVVALRPDGSSKEAQALGWLDTGERQLCPRHNPFPSLGRVDELPRLRDQAPFPRGHRPKPPEVGTVTPLRPAPTDGTV